ncbi:MAG: hypothetical protein R3A10_12195 [Caldilineaceae bacterium]
MRGADLADQDVIITKGALANVLDVCAHVRIGAQSLPFTDDVRAQIQQQTDAANAQGYRILGVATRAVPPQPRYTRTDETDMTFVGYLLFLDPPKEGARATLAVLADLGDAGQSHHRGQQTGDATHGEHPPGCRRTAC